MRKNNNNNKMSVGGSTFQYSCTLERRSFKLAANLVVSVII